MNKNEVFLKDGADVEQTPDLKHELTEIKGATKYLLLALFLVLPVIGFYIGSQYSKAQFELKETSVQTPVSKSETARGAQTPSSATNSLFAAPAPEIDLTTEVPLQDS